MHVGTPRQAGSIAGLCVGLIVIGFAFATTNQWHHATELSAGSKGVPPPSGQAGAAGADYTGPLGPSGKKYTLEEAQDLIPSSRFVLPQTSLTSNDGIEAIWATDGQNAETWIQYKTGIVVTEEVPSWDLPTATPRPSPAPTDVASLGQSMLSDGSGMKGEVTQIGGQDAFVAYASDPSHEEGPGSVVVEVDGSEDSIIGTTSAVTMDNLSSITSALIQAGRSAA